MELKKGNDAFENRIVLEQIEKEKLKVIIDIIDTQVGIWQERNFEKLRSKLEDFDILKITKESNIDVSDDFLNSSHLEDSEKIINTRQKEIGGCEEKIKNIDDTESIFQKIKPIIENRESWFGFLFSIEDDMYEGWNSWVNTTRPKLIKLL